MKSYSTPAQVFVVQYFAQRLSFCVSMCPNYAPMSDTCAVAEGDMDAERCPDLVAALREKAA